jgi:PHD/YefM family antitoxin component YafN of YafNO toxin-antitoxin module
VYTYVVSSWRPGLGGRVERPFEQMGPSQGKRGEHMRAPNEVKEIGRRQLRERLAPLLNDLEKGRTLAAVTNRNKVEAFLVPVPLFEEYEQAFDERDQAQGELRELRDLVPLLIAALSSGAAIPSELLSRAGIRLDYDWKKINALQAAYPLRITHDEEGRPLATMPPISHHPIAESDEEFELET